MAEPVPPDSERRVATILFADISGFTLMSEKLDPETLTDLMNACFSAIGKVADRKGGFVDKYIGDCAMVLFGAPQTVECAPDKALYAALEIRAAIERINIELAPPVPLRVHTGINTGMVIAGHVGSQGAMSYTVMGSPVNLAARLKDAAGPGQILIGDETRAHLRDAFSLAETKVHTAKGKTHLAWELLSAPTETGRPARSSCPDRPPLVGRKAELGTMERAARQAAEGDGSIFILMGETGIGKSALVEGFLQSPVAEGYQILVGHCRSDAVKQPYLPFIEAIRSWAQRDSHELERLSRKIEMSAAVDNAEVAPLIAALLGLSLPVEIEDMLTRMEEEIRERLIQNAVRILLSHLAVVKPLVFVVEDLHFADQSSLELLESCLGLAAEKPMFFLLTARPNYPEAAAWVARVQGGERTVKVRELHLAALDLASSALLVDALSEIRDFDPNLRRRIVEKAGGNPQFIEELVRSIPDGTDLPSSIGEAFMFRIDRLDAEAREVLKMVAVAGPMVLLRLLREAMPWPVAICGGLRRLVDAGFLAVGSGDGGVAYHFVSEAARDVTYASLVSSRRKELHRAVAEAIERLNEGRLSQVAGLLALHYSRAELFDKAEFYMVLAGESALKTVAANEAISYCRDALELCLAKGRGEVTPEKIDRIERSIALSLYHKGRYREALPYYERILVRHGFRKDDGSFSSSLRMARGWIKMVRFIIIPEGRTSRPLPAELQDCAPLLWQKCSMLAALGDIKSLARAAGIIAYRFKPYGFRDVEMLLAMMILIAFILTWSGKMPAVGKRILDITKPMLRPEFGRVQLFYINMDEVWHLISGDYSGRWLFRDPLVASPVDREGIFHALHTLYHACTMSVETGDWETYNEAKTRLEKETQRFDTDVGRGFLASAAIRTVLKRRDFEEAARIVPLVLDNFARTGYQAFRILAVSSRFALMEGDFPGAVAEFERGEKAREGHGGVAIGDGYHFGAAAAIAVERARAAAARGARTSLVFRNGRADVRRYLAASRNFAPDLPEALKFAGALAWHSGKPKLALANWKKSIEMAERCGAKVELAHTLWDAALLLGEKNPGPEWRTRGATLYSELGIDEAQSTRVRIDLSFCK